MINQAQTITLRSNLLAVLLVGLWACTLEGAEPLEDDAAVELEQANSVSWPSAVESDVESDPLADLIEPPDTDENTQLQAGLAAASSGNVQADFNGDGYSDLAIGVPFEDLNAMDDGGVHVLYGSPSGLTATNNQFWSQSSADVLGDPGDFDRFGQAMTAGDFNADGYGDLAIGVPFDSVNSVRAGAVNVLYGSASGLTAEGNQLWHQDSPGIEDQPGNHDFFGLALTSGDFNADGYFDLAVSAPQDDPNGIQDAGLINVIYGSATGLTEVDNQIWHQDTPGVDGVAEPFDVFALTLAAGDFDGDGRDDLAVGTPAEAVGSIDFAGAINVLYGSNSGLSGSGDQYWHQDTDGIKGVAEPFDQIGTNLAVGDFDDDGFDDLVVTADLEDVGSIMEAGAVHVIYGSGSGLGEAGDQYWHQNVSGVDNTADARDQFGAAVAVGDFDADGRDDLAIGVLEEDVGAIQDAGMVYVLYGSGSGLSEDDDQIWHQNIDGVDGVAEASEYLGDSLSAGDFDGDGAGDLVIGVPFEDVGSVSTAGAVNVLYGTGAGLTEEDDQVWHQNSPGVLETAEPGDRLSHALG